MEPDTSIRTSNMGTASWPQWLNALTALVQEKSSMAKMFNFPPPRRFRELDQLVINRGQRDMILDYCDKLIAQHGGAVAEDISHISTMVYAFCKETGK